MMKTLLLCASLACSTFALSPALSQDHRSGGHSGEVRKAINANCPVGKEPIDPSAGTVEYKGNAIGLCCPGCGKQFLAWDEARKDEFVAQAVSHSQTGKAHAPDGKSADKVKAWTDPYPLGTCPISGKELGSMGDPVVKKYDGREVRFCCSGCISKFEADLDASWKKVDHAIIKDQLRYFSIQTCIVSDEPLVQDGEDIASNFVYGNRLVRLCCKMCKGEFKANPAKFIEKLDKATADAQRKEYPLDTCIVAGGKLGSMGEPYEMVIAGRLLRFCCGGCKPKVMADPAKYIGLIDAAWQAKGMFMPGKDPGHGDHGDHGSHGSHGGHD